MNRTVNFDQPVLKSEVIVCLLLLLSLMGVGYFDYKTGPQISLGLFYIFPVGAAAWWFGRRSGVTFAVFAGAVALVAALTSSDASRFADLWNAGNRLGICLAVAIGGSSVSSRIRMQQQLVAELRRALLRASDTSNLVPVCPLCDRFRDDPEFRSDVEGFVARQPDRRAFGSPCPQCLVARRRLMASVA